MRCAPSHTSCCAHQQAQRPLDVGEQLTDVPCHDQPVTRGPGPQALGLILELVATSDAVRPEAQNAELTELLRHRVEEFHSADPSSGYAAHLAAALDCRQWHEVNVTILGPEEGQQRRLSRRAKLSQGETLFVSYVTLFAAADGCLTSLGDDGRGAAADPA